MLVLIGVLVLAAGPEGMKLYVFTSGSIGGFSKRAIQIGGQGAGASEPSTAGLASSSGVPQHVPSIRSKRCGGPAGSGLGGGECNAGEALGNR